jgi:protein-S-isoprenylcysteine O-methyltransferase Ste14
MEGFFAPWLIYLLLLALNMVVPGRWVTGYVDDEKTGEKLRYWINGRAVLDVTVVLWVMGCGLGWLSWDGLYTHRWPSLAGAITFGLIFSAAFVLPQPSQGRSLPIEFFLGRIKNAQLLGGRIDAKMWLYLVGAVLLQLHVLSFTAHHLLTYGAAANPGVVLSAAMLTWFIWDYLTFEEIHLYTYDIFAERVGFKLGWGCLAFYPYFYAIGLWNTVDQPSPGQPGWLLLLSVVIFFTGWSLARGANMQKFAFKQDPKQEFLGLVPESITDGERTLLVSGFWGASRHINYLGEILMAVGIAVSLGYPLMLGPWLYPLYYVVLFVTRQRDDDARCAEKYGPLWDEYTRRVPYRIVPYLY